MFLMWFIHKINAIVKVWLINNSLDDKSTVTEKYSCWLIWKFYPKEFKCFVPIQKKTKYDNNFGVIVQNCKIMSLKVIYVVFDKKP